MLGEILNQDKYEYIVRGSILSDLTLDELIDIAINNKEMNFLGYLTKFWEFAGVYYKYNDSNLPVIIIDREQSVGGYNNSELTICISGDKLLFNDSCFERVVNERIVEKLRQPSAQDEFFNDL